MTNNAALLELVARYMPPTLPGFLRSVSTNPLYEPFHGPLHARYHAAMGIIDWGTLATLTGATLDPSLAYDRDRYAIAANGLYHAVSDTLSGDY